MRSDLAPVLSLDDARVRADERFATEIQQLIARLAALRDVVIEPPDHLLSAILAQLDEVDRLRLRVGPSHRWVAAAGGIAAGAIVLVGRSAWSRLAS